MLSRKRKSNDYTRKTSPRLKHFIYEGYNCYFITCCISEGKKFFTDEKTVKTVLAILKETANSHDFYVNCYCFMPDHLHLLVSGNKENSSLKNFIRMFKQKSSFEFKTSTKNTLWQRSYYDHVLRRTEDLGKIAHYILNNPVRKGLVKDFRDYPYSSLSLELET